MAKYNVYGVGNALVDLQARVPDDLLTQLKIDKGVMTLVDDDQQASVVTSLDGRPLNRCAGGSAANTIVALAEFGGSAAFVGKIGQDVMGEFFLQDMRDLGVTIDVQPADLHTGTCAVLITDDAQRTMLTNLGASVTLHDDDIHESIIKDSDFVYVEGYLLFGESTKAAAYRAIDLAKKNNVKVAFTASDPFLVDALRDEIWDLITGPVDLLFCNEDEAKSLAGESDIEACAEKIHSHAPHLAITLGPKGSILFNEGERYEIEGVPVDAIDTTGAGDMYAGALLYGLTNGMGWKQAGTLASHAAARVVSQLGARLEHKFSEAEIQQLCEA